MDQDNPNDKGKAQPLPGATPGVYPTYIAGLKFRKGATDRWGQIEDGTVLELAPEPDNQYDQFAVKILDTFTDETPFHLGYVPRFLAPRVFSACISADYKVHCVADRGKIKITIAAKGEQITDDSAA